MHAHTHKNTPTDKPLKIRLKIKQKRQAKGRLNNYIKITKGIESWIQNLYLVSNVSKKILYEKNRLLSFPFVFHIEEVKHESLVLLVLFYFF